MPTNTATKPVTKHATELKRYLDVLHADDGTPEALRRLEDVCSNALFRDHNANPGRDHEMMPWVRKSMETIKRARREDVSVQLHAIDAAAADLQQQIDDLHKAMADLKRKRDVVRSHEAEVKNVFTAMPHNLANVPCVRLAMTKELLAVGFVEPICGPQTFRR